MGQVMLMGILHRFLLVSFKKTIAVSTRVKFLGIVIDSVVLELLLPEDKVYIYMHNVCIYIMHIGTYGLYIYLSIYLYKSAGINYYIVAY